MIEMLSLLVSLLIKLKQQLNNNPKSNKTMKRLIMAAIAVLLLTTANAQDVYHADVARMAIRDDYKSDYIWEKWTHEDVDITIDGSIVTFGNKAHTVLETQEVVEELKYEPKIKGSTIYWSAIDQDDKDCGFRMTFYDTGTVGITLYYSDFAVRFQQTKGIARLDKFRED